jgi:GNAT superfamily N-acetyltransferase
MSERAEGTGPDGAVRVDPVTPASWPLVEAVLGQKGDPRRCWCQWFLQRNAQWQASSAAERKEALEAEVAAAGTPPPGLVATMDGEPAGWCRVGPRTGYPRLTASTKARAAGDDLGDPSVWAVVCFVVAPAARGTGLTSVLLDAAVATARAGGARVVEAYPVDVGARPGVNASALYHGSLSTFLAAGFVEVTRTTAARPVVRLDL